MTDLYRRVGAAEFAGLRLVEEFMSQVPWDFGGGALIVGPR